MAINLPTCFWDRNYDGTEIFSHDISGSMSINVSWNNYTKNKILYGDGASYTTTSSSIHETHNYPNQPNYKVLITRPILTVINLSGYSDKDASRRLYLKLKNMPNLTNVRFDGIPLDSLTFNGNDLPNLQVIDISYGYPNTYRHNTIDVTTVTTLTVLYINGSAATILNLDNNVNLQYLKVNNIPSTTLNLDNNVNLIELISAYNNFSTIQLDGTSYNDLYRVYLEVPSSVDLSNLENLQVLGLHLHGNGVDLSNNHYLQSLTITTADTSGALNTTIHSLDIQEDPIYNPQLINISLPDAVNSEATFDISNLRNKIWSLDLNGSQLGEFIHYTIESGGPVAQQIWSLMGTRFVDIRNSSLTNDEQAAVIVNVASCSNGGQDYSGYLLLKNDQFSDPWTSQIGITYVDIASTTIPTLVSNGWYVYPTHFMTDNGWYYELFSFEGDSNNIRSAVYDTNYGTWSYPTSNPGGRFHSNAVQNVIFYVDENSSPSSIYRVSLDTNDHQFNIVRGVVDDVHILPGGGSQLSVYARNSYDSQGYVNTNRINSAQIESTETAYYFLWENWTIVEEGDFSAFNGPLPADITYLPYPSTNSIEHIQQLRGNFIEIVFNSNQSHIIPPYQPYFSSMDDNTGYENDTRTIYGGNLQGVSSVTFGGNSASINNISSDGYSMSVNIPYGSGLVDIELISLGAGSTVATEAFTYL